MPFVIVFLGFVAAVCAGLGAYDLAWSAWACLGAGLLGGSIGSTVATVLVLLQAAAEPDLSSRRSATS